ncbi:MAG: insulinase family protein [Muribaculaceae bacterium]|nr:insulinase family protein [Muribaculaceae bacterium]
MKRLLTATAIAFGTTFAALAADLDPAVRTGVLDNGMTYYLQHNENPRGTADYFLAQSVGSAFEDDDQRGLAHFLEHMCFNGTEHFPGNSLITYLESIGVKFGAHLNAYTSTDEIVYNICKAPTVRQGSIDSCMLILRDWSCGILLRPEDIDAERGVIVSEARQRSSATNRMLERASAKLYGGSAYGERMPIGKMEVVENFKPEVLRRFYDRWNVPVNQAVIIVGDIDLDSTEIEIKKLFGAIPAKRSALSQKSHRPVVPVADSLICAVESDPEQGSEMLQLYWRVSSDDSFRTHALSEMTGNILVDRFEVLEASDDCPHLSLALGKTKYFMAGGEQAFTMRGPVKAGRAADAVKAWYGELVRVIQHGIGEDEVVRARENLVNGADEHLRTHANPSNTVLAKQAVRHYLDGGQQISAAAVRDSVVATAETITPEDIKGYIESLLYPRGRGAVILHYRPKNELTDSEDEALLRAAVDTAFARQYEPYSPMLKSADKLFETLPVRGSIVATDSLALFDAKVYTLSNGIKVIAKHTDYKPGQVYIRGYSPGGLSLNYRNDDVATLRVVNELMGEMKHGGHTAADIRRITTGHNVKVSASVGNNEEGIEAATTADDMDMAFGLLYLRATAFEPDSVAFRTFIDNQRNSVSHKKYNPSQAFGDSIHHAIYNHHPLAARMKAEDVDNISMGRAFEVYKDRYGDMSDFTFMVVGDFNTDSLTNCLEQYIASLPGAGRKESAIDFGYDFTPYDFQLLFSRQMENPQGFVYNFYSGPAAYTLDNILNAAVFGQLLRNRLLADLRESRGWTYSIRTHAGINPGLSATGGPSLLMPTNIKVQPGYEQATLDIVNATIKEMADATVISAEEVAGIKEFLLKSFDESATDNAYWLKVIKSYERDGMDMHNTYRAAVEALSPETVAAFVRDTVLPAHKSSIIMQAE